MTDDLLAIYLTDHLAGATAGTKRMRRLAEQERSASDGAALEAVATGIEQDRQTLEMVMAAADVSPRWYKTVAARIAEGVGLIKTNGRLVRRSPLTSVVELEMMCMAVTGKAALWEALKQTDLSERFDFGELIDRALQQRHMLETSHRARAGVVGQRSTADMPVDAHPAT
jgi:hypothetical protein